MNAITTLRNVKYYEPKTLLKPFSRNSTRSRGKRYFRQCFRFNFRPEVDDNVISHFAVDNLGVDIHVKFGDSRSSGFRFFFRGADFVSNEQTNMTKPIPIERNAFQAFA